MKIVTWKLLFVITWLWCEANCRTVTSCNGSVSINCEDFAIAIMDGGSVAPYIAEKCNARKECELNVPIKSGQCINVNYWCQPDIPTLETEKSSKSKMQLDKNQNIVGLISEGYRDGIYQRASNVSCKITIAQQANQEKNISFILYDFATSANHSDFCLSLADSTSHPFCSGSQKYYTTHGPFIVKNKRQFHIKLTRIGIESTQEPRVRFWFGIRVAPKDVYFDQIECESKAAAGKDSDLALSSKEPSDAKKSNAFTVIISSVMGVVLLLTLVAFASVSACWYRQRNRKTGNNAGAKDEDAYTYIDMESVASLEDLAKVEEIAQSIAKAKLAGLHVSQASLGTIPDQCVLPSPRILQCGNGEPNPRDACNDQCDPEEGLHPVIPARLLSCRKSRDCVSVDGSKKMEGQLVSRHVESAPEYGESENGTSPGHQDINTDMCEDLEETMDVKKQVAEDQAQLESSPSTNECTILNASEASTDSAEKNIDGVLPIPENAKCNNNEAEEESRKLRHDKAGLDAGQEGTETTVLEGQNGTLQDQTDEDDDSIVNEYTSLSPIEAAGDGPDNSAEYDYTALSIINCTYKIKAAMVGRNSVEPKKTGAKWDGTDDSGDENDYLVLLPDDFDQTETLPVESTETVSGEALNVTDQEKVYKEE